MLRAVSTLRPLARTTVSRSLAARTFASTPRALSEEHHGPPSPQLYGPGNAPIDAIPTDQQQATGLERFQLLGKMEGIDVFDMRALDSSRLGTMKDPIKVPTLVSFVFSSFEATFFSARVERGSEIMVRGAEENTDFFSCLSLLVP